MAGRTPAEAVDAFLEPLGRTVSCLTRTVVNVSGGYHAAAAKPHVLVLGDGEPVELRGGDLSLGLAQYSRIVETDDQARGPWKVRTAGYQYELLRGADEFLRFEWHPDSRSHATFPDLHVGGAACQDGASLLSRTHLPTGRITLEQIVRLAIEELDVHPLRGDWQEILAASDEAFRQWRTWG